MHTFFSLLGFCNLIFLNNHLSTVFKSKVLNLFNLQSEELLSVELENVKLNILRDEMLKIAAGIGGVKLDLHLIVRKILAKCSISPKCLT